MIRCILTMIPLFVAVASLVAGAMMELAGVRASLLFGMLMAIISASVFIAVMESD